MIYCDVWILFKNFFFLIHWKTLYKKQPLIPLQKRILTPKSIIHAF